MSAPVTQWFDGVPPRRGVWEVDRKDDYGRAFSRWTGNKWSYVSWERLNDTPPSGNSLLDAVRSAAKDKDMRYDMPRWRGLADKPVTGEAG